MTNVLVVLCTASKLKEAEKIAQVLVEERLAACVNLIPHIESRYWWEGRVQAGSEVLLMIKTVKARFKKLEKRILELHSYDVPEILAIPVVLGGKSYLAWLLKTVGQKQK